MASASGVVLVPVLLAPVMAMVAVLLVPVLVLVPGLLVPGLLLVPALLRVESHLLGLPQHLETLDWPKWQVADVAAP